VTELRREASVGVTPWHRREAAQRPWHDSMRGGGGGAAGSVQEGGREGGPGGLAQPTWPLRAKRPDGPTGHWADWAES
jgi:hypothetical protein